MPSAERGAVCFRVVTIGVVQSRGMVAAAECCTTSTDPLSLGVVAALARKGREVLARRVSGTELFVKFKNKEQIECSSAISTCLIVKAAPTKNGG